MAWGDYFKGINYEKKKILKKFAFGLKTKSFNVKKDINLYAFKLKSINKVKSRK